MLYHRLEGLPGKPLLVLVHSLGCDHGMWEPQMPALLRHFRVLRVDLRGHGASETTPGEYSIELLAKDVLEVVNSTGITRFAYCGLSLGGMIGQWLAANVGERIDGLVLANTSPRMPDPTAFDTRRKLVLEKGMVAIEEPVMGRFFSARTLASENPTVESIRTVLLKTNPVGYAGCCSAIRDMDQRPLLAGLKLPVLVIAGTEDVSTPWEGHGDLLASSIANAKSALFAGAHLSNVEQPSSFTSAILEFLLPHVGDTLEAGASMRRSVLGDPHVDASMASATDLNRDFQEYITRSVWGSIWTRPLLDPKVRRLLVLAMTAAMGRWEEFRLHVKTGLSHELEPVELKELLMQVAPYAGVPAANTGFHIAAEEAKAVSPR